MSAQTLPAKWEEQFNTGVEFLDEQHRYFFTVAKRLEAVINHHNCSDQVADIFFSLVHYVEHFRLREEIYYKDLKLKKIDEHKNLHLDFVAGIVQFKDEYTRGEKDVCRNLLRFLTNWFYEHIIGTDNDMIAELKKAGL